MQTSVAVFKHNDSLVARDLAGEKVIIPVKAKVGDLGCIYTLNSIANEIWNLLDGQRTESDIVEMLARDYEVDVETLASDVNHALTEMQQEGLIVNGITAGGCG